MTLNEIVALASVPVSIGANAALFIHLSATVNGRFDSFESKMENRFDSFERKVEARFDSVERRADVMLSKVIDIDNRLTRVEERMEIRH